MAWNATECKRKLGGDPQDAHKAGRCDTFCWPVLGIATEHFALRTEGTVSLCSALVVGDDVLCGMFLGIR